MGPIPSDKPSPSSARVYIYKYMWGKFPSLCLHCLDPGTQHVCACSAVLELSSQRQAPASRCFPARLTDLRPPENGLLSHLLWQTSDNPPRALTVRTSACPSSNTAIFLSLVSQLIQSENSLTPIRALTVPILRACSGVQCAERGWRAAGCVDGSARALCLTCLKLRMFLSYYYLVFCFSNEKWMLNWDDLTMSLLTSCGSPEINPKS